MIEKTRHALLTSQKVEEFRTSWADVVVGFLASAAGESDDGGGGGGGVVVVVVC